MKTATLTPNQATLANSLNDWDLLMAVLSYSGALRDAISGALWRSLYLLCDGFGRVDARTAAVRLEWDWSHVRDSSDEAVARAAAAARVALGLA